MDDLSLVMLKALVDPGTAAKVSRFASESAPQRTKSEMVRHLLRLGIKAYESREAEGRAA